MNTKTFAEKENWLLKSNCNFLYISLFIGTILSAISSSTLNFVMGVSASWIRGSDPAINLSQETMTRYLCIFKVVVVFLLLSYQYRGVGIRTWDLRPAIYQLRDITQCLRPLRHHGRSLLKIMPHKISTGEGGMEDTPSLACVQCMPTLFLEVPVSWDKVVKVLGQLPNR